MPVKAPPPPKKGQPPARSETKNNLSSPEPGKTVALNFRVSADMKKDFKITAAMAGITQSQLLAQAFEEWKGKHS